MSQTAAIAKYRHVNASAVLTGEEIQQLTGYKRAAEQLKAMRAMGLRPFVRPDGTPGVLREAVVQAQVERRRQEEFVLDLS